MKRLSLLSHGILLLILSSLSLARAITAEASLSFLGLGIDPPLPT